LKGRTWTKSVLEWCAEEDTEIKRNEVTGEWRRLHNDKLDYYTLQHVVFRDPNEEYQMGGACGMNGGDVRAVLWRRLQDKATWT
jgi:hypothetical protein